ncbi:MAG: CDP-alcohol phosphatidyltransferase family protein [Blautia sp.]|nr:CDP-alcohol phosphatidyltransferase family protein [Blautia sp.]MDY3998916.1 CDP-alcohol phosphatidyltransferase family protein [Blautia sp.]
MIGIYDYTVVLTYISFASAAAGIFCASTMHLRWSIFFLALSGLCDMFDGKIARTKKNRTDDEKSFGIQIDSLCDIVCFGILPMIICFKLGMDHIYSMIILTLYGLAGLIRLAFFNVMEAKRQESTEVARKYYQGLPITSMAVVLPLLFLVSPLFPTHDMFLVVLHIMVALVGILFITDFKFRKPSTKEVLLLVILVAAAVLVILFIWRSWWRLLHFYE